MRPWLIVPALALTALLQGCAQPPPASTTRVFQADVTGGAKKCQAPKLAPTAGKTADAPVNVGNDGGWCGIVVSNAGKPFDAGLLVAPPAHGTVLIHTVGDDTRVDYTPDARFSGADAFTVRLIPGDATIRANVTVGPA